MENATAKASTEEKVFALPNRKVMVTPIRRKGGWVDVTSENNFLFKHAYFKLIVPMSKFRKDTLVDPLTKAERTFFESSEAGLGLNTGDLLIHNKTATFWKEFSVRLDKNIMVLDLSDPMDYITYKVLLVNTGLIAPSAEQKTGKATYKYAIVEEGHDANVKVKAASNKKEAWKFFGKIDEDTQKMRDFLGIYTTLKPKGKSLPPNAKKSFLISQLEGIIENDLAGFLAVAKDKDYNKKVLITNALNAKALMREGLTFKTPEDRVIGDSMKEVINFFNDPKNNEEIIKMKARIDNSK